MISAVIKIYLLNFLFLLSSSADNNFVIYENEMPEEMKNLALTTTQLEINKKNDIKIISKKLVDTFNNEYGKQWFSIIGPNGVTAQIRHKPKTLIDFSINDIHVLLFKPALLSQTDIISESRHNNAKIRINENQLNEVMKTNAQIVSTIAIKSYNNFHQISQNISNSFNEKYGQQWNCIVGEIGIDMNVEYIFGTLISFSIGEMQIIIYQTSADKSHIKSDIDYIKSARNLLTQVKLIGSQMSDEMTNEVISIAKKTIMSVDNFGSLSKSISNHFVEKYGNVWVCTVANIMCTGLNDWVNGTFFAAKIGGLQIEIFQSKFSNPKSDIDYIKSARNSLTEVKLIGSQMSDEMTNEVISIAKKTIMSVDNFGSLSKRISNHFVEKYGNVWVCSVANIMCTGLNDWVNGTFFAAKIGGIQIEIFQSKFNNPKQNSTTHFSGVIEKAKTSGLKINTETVSSTDKTNILKIVANSLTLDFTDCTGNPENWYDPYGQCYRKIGEYIVKSLGGFTEYGWSVTVGESNSHWNYCTSPVSDISVFFQFNYGELHFNIVKYKPKTS